MSVLFYAAKLRITTCNKLRLSYKLTPKLVKFCKQNRLSTDNLQLTLKEQVKYIEFSFQQSINFEISSFFIFIKAFVTFPALAGSLIN